MSVAYLLCCRPLSSVVHAAVLSTDINCAINYFVDALSTNNSTVDAFHSTNRQIAASNVKLDNVIQCADLGFYYQSG